MTTVVSPTIADRVAAVLAAAPSWTHGRRRADGREFFIIPASKGAGVYYADATDCTCAAARLSAVKIPCKHSLAIRQYLADAPAATAQPAPLTCTDCGAELPTHVVGGSMCSECWSRREGVKQELVRAERNAYKARLRASLGMLDEAVA